MKKNGFTLIELLSVIALISVLLLLTMPSVMEVVTRSKDNGYRDSVRSLFKSIQLKITEDRTLTSGDLSDLDFPDNQIVSALWEYDEATNIITVRNVVFPDNRVVCVLTYAQRSEEFPITESCS